MQVVPNVATTDNYPAAGSGSGAELGPDPNALQLIYVVANAAVFAQFRPVRPDGTIAPYGPEVLVTPSTNTVTRVSGARFRSAVAGTPARVVAVLLEPDDPQFGGGTPFTGVLAASGGITPGVASVQVEKDGALIGQEAALNIIGTGWTIADNGALGRIDITPQRVVTGVISSAGAIVAGTGFSVVRVPTGLYNITFTVPFAAMPCVQCSCKYIGSNSWPQYVTPTINGFGIQVLNNALSGADDEVHFIAMGMV